MLASQRRSSLSCGGIVAITAAVLVTAASLAALFLGRNGPGSQFGGLALLVGAAVVPGTCLLALTWGRARRAFEAARGERAIASGLVAALVAAVILPGIEISPWILAACPLGCLATCLATNSATNPNAGKNAMCPDTHQPPQGQNEPESLSEAVGLAGIGASFLCLGFFWSFCIRSMSLADGVFAITLAIALIAVFARQSSKVDLTSALAWALPCVAISLALQEQGSIMALGIAKPLLVGALTLACFAAMAKASDTTRTHGPLFSLGTAGAFIVGGVSVKLLLPVLYADSGATLCVELFAVAAIAVASALLNASEQSRRSRAEGNAKRLGEKVRELEADAASGPADSSTALLEELSRQGGLTPREANVLVLLARGYSLPSIRDKLGISVGTVGSHAKRIYVKLGVHTKDELIDLCSGE